MFSSDLKKQESYAFSHYVSAYVCHKFPPQILIEFYCNFSYFKFRKQKRGLAKKIDRIVYSIFITDKH